MFKSKPGILVWLTSLGLLAILVLSLVGCTSTQQSATSTGSSALTTSPVSASTATSAATTPGASGATTTATGASPTTSRATTGSPTPTATGAAGPFTVDTQIKTDHSPLTLSQIANIQPGLGTVMIEYAIRFNNLWFAADKGNWDMAHYQILEMTEIQEVAETTRANRAQALKSFEDNFLTPLDKAALAKNKSDFTTAYDNAIVGCNACHAGSSSSDFSTYKFVKIQRPTASDFNNVDWAGQ